MKKLRLVLITMLVSMGVYFALTWPAIRYFHEGVPSSNRPEAGGARYMIPGDHLQFMYQLWMLADSFTGKTPLFYHVYEFNQGDDQALYNPGSYYFPFGLLYSAGYALGGRVIGWNLMLCVTVWLIYLATFILIRRFTQSGLTAGVAALPSILLPYFHVSLLGGSPTGLGMTWVPLIFLGVDVAIRDRRMWGGVLAGLLLAIVSWVDLHVFFFVFLATPVWALMCMAYGVRQGNDPLQSPRKWLPLLPVLIGMLLAYMQTAVVKASLDHTLQSQGRSIKESLGYALRAPGWFDTSLDNRFNLVYLGVWVMILLSAGVAVMAVDVLRRRNGSVLRLGLMIMVLGAVGGIAVLALGPNTPFDREHRLWQFLRTVIPPYKMIRQPAKIYCLLTPFLGLALAMTLDRFNQYFSRRAGAILLSGVVAAGIVWDYGRRLEPTICLLDYEQGAYRAVAEDALATGRDNRAMALPLWPGDSHWNSITEYYATLYRTKMLNGYSPSVSRQYFTDVFLRFESVNMGLVTDAILDGLLRMKIGYLILHEDAFPQKVSPFPASLTLSELMRHPRLQFLAHDKAVWSFKILPESFARTPTNNLEQGPILSAWQWDACDTAGGAATVMKDGRTVSMRLPEKGGWVKLDTRAVSGLDGLRYVVSVRGTGRLMGSCGTGLSNDVFSVGVTNGNHWEWVELPVPVLPPGRETGLTLTFTNMAGHVDVSMVTLIAGPWKWLMPGESMEIPARTFWRTGYSDTNGCVRLDRDRTQASVAFYVPVVPVTPGVYGLVLNYRVSPQVDGGTPLGELSVLHSDGQDRVTVPVVSGRSCVLTYRLENPRPLRIEFRYSRAADMLIDSAGLKRLE